MLNWLFRILPPTQKPPVAAPAPAPEPNRQTDRRPVRGQHAIWRSAVQARLDFNLPASAVPALVRPALEALERGEGLTDTVVELRRCARALARNPRPAAVATSLHHERMHRRRRQYLAPLDLPPGSDNGPEVA